MRLAYSCHDSFPSHDTNTQQIVWTLLEVARLDVEVELFVPSVEGAVSGDARAPRAASAFRASLRETVAGPSRWVLSAQLPLVGVLLLASGAVLSIYGPGFRQGAMWLALLGLAHGANSFAGLVETLIMIERPALNLVNAIQRLMAGRQSGKLGLDSTSPVTRQ